MSKNRYQYYKKYDPYYLRECEKYTNPAPSREYILQCLEEIGEPLTYDKLISIFNLKDAERQEALRRRLIAMEKQGQLMRNRRGKYAVVSKLALIQGRVVGHKEGFGFLVPDDKSGDLFIAPYHMRVLFPGDMVLARIAEGSKNKREAIIVEILERPTRLLVGRYIVEHGIAFVQPHHKHLTQDIVIPAGEQGNAKNGQYVVIEIVSYPNIRRQATGRVTEVLGDHLSPGMEIEVAIRTYEIPNCWSEEVEKEVAIFKSQLSEVEKQDRVDIRHLPLVTIDGEDAKDFDDAVYCTQTKNKAFQLIVGIADVSHYVRPETALDKAAYERGNSVYFPGRVVPMLPEKLSNDLCSLKPDVDRLCIVCDMKISTDGLLVSAKFYKAIMRSRARLTYNEVTAILADKTKLQTALKPYLENLHRVYQKMLIQRQQRGALDFETLETRIIFSKNQKIKDIIPVKRTEAHRIIEECMLMANVATAHFLTKHKIPTLYRIHQGPNPDKMENLQGFLQGFGLQLTGLPHPTPQDYQQLLQKVGDRPDSHLIQTVLLRSLKQAVYAADNIGHFGLSYPTYLHFTSPIRRYPDLLVHRAICYQLKVQQKRKLARMNKKIAATGSVILKKSEKLVFIYDKVKMTELGTHCSYSERRADEATRDAISWLKCYYMKDKLGQEFAGIISGVTAFGVFVELTQIYVEGLLHISALCDDYYHYDPIKQALQGKHTGTVYRLGDAIQVRLVRANPEERELDLELVAKPKKLKKLKTKLSDSIRLRIAKPLAKK